LEIIKPKVPINKKLIIANTLIKISNIPGFDDQKCLLSLTINILNILVNISSNITKLLSLVKSKLKYFLLMRIEIIPPIIKNKLTGREATVIFLTFHLFGLPVYFTLSVEIDIVRKSFTNISRTIPMVEIIML
jgi:hypothetical protein